jgi:hypothetical protein
MYIGLLHRLRDAVKKKRHEKWWAKSSFLLHENIPAYRSVLIKDFLAKNNVTTIHHPLYSPNMASADFDVFVWLKTALKGRHCCDATDIIKNATDELKRLSQNVFQECFQYLYSRWQKCIVVQGDCLEGNAASFIVIFCIFSETYWFREHLKAGVYLMLRSTTYYHQVKPI